MEGSYKDPVLRKLDEEPYYKTPQLKMTEADEQRRIDDEVKKFKTRIRLLNRQNKIIQITGFKLQINHPAATKIIPWYLKIFKRK